jgi:hypothetical protein
MGDQSDRPTIRERIARVFQGAGNVVSYFPGPQANLLSSALSNTGGLISGEQSAGSAAQGLLQDVRTGVSGGANVPSAAPTPTQQAPGHTPVPHPVAAQGITQPAGMHNPYDIVDSQGEIADPAPYGSEGAGQKKKTEGTYTPKVDLLGQHVRQKHNKAF